MFLQLVIYLASQMNVSKTPFSTWLIDESSDANLFVLGNTPCLFAPTILLKIRCVFSKFWDSTHKILRVVMTCAPKAQKCKRRNLKRLHFVFEALLGITTSIFVYIYIYIYIYICLIQHDNFHIGMALKGFSSSKVLYTDPKHFFKPHFTSDHQFAFYTVKTSTYTSPFYPRCVFFRQ